MLTKKKNYVPIQVITLSNDLARRMKRSDNKTQKDAFLIDPTLTVNMIKLILIKKIYKLSSKSTPSFKQLVVNFSFDGGRSLLSDVTNMKTLREIYI